jgi:peptidyl-prolyl cis-trans isomerase D
MLELIQKRLQTVVIAGTVVILSLVFVVSFQAPSGGGCRTRGTGFAARVYGTTITEGDFRAAYTLLGFHTYPVERARTLRLRELTMDGLIERELLAHEAERMGFTADPRDVLREVAESSVIWATPPVDAPEGYPGPQIPGRFTDRDGQFSMRNMRAFIQNYLRRSIEEFERWQVRERLAQMTREAVLVSVTVSPREVRDQYERETERAVIEYVRYTPLYYRDRIEVADGAVRAWMEEHAEQVDQEYRRQRHRYTGLEEQRRARHILIKAAADAPESERTAARRRAEELLRRARAGEDFAALARQYSEDTATARRGGDLGWNPRGRMVASFDEAQFSTEPGQITDHVVETRFGFHVIKVEGRREGDVPEEEAKLEIAQDLFRNARAAELAAQEARRALAFLREGHSMEELDQRLAWDWRDRPAAGPDGAAPEPPERDTFAPQVRESHSFGRTDTPIAGVPNAAELTRIAFELTLDAPLPPEPIQLGDDYYVIRLRQRTEATDENFTEDVQRRIRDQLLQSKRAEVLRAFVRGLRERARRDGELRVNEEVLSYGDGNGDDDEDEGGMRRSEPEEASLLPRSAPCA